MDKPPLTKQGFEFIRTELHELKTKARPEISQAIGEARAHGDLKENAEYHAAKEQQALLEKKIAILESTLANCVVIDVKEIPYTGKVVFGSTLTLYDIDEEREIKYKIVGNLESNPDNGLISIDTPIARGLLGKGLEEEVAIETPAGIKKFEIIDIKHI
ncbi:MAG: transcription elongation factor GreA [Gammaproteobacteria bacterium]